MVRYRWIIKNVQQFTGEIARKIVGFLGSFCVLLIILLALYVMYDADRVASGTIIGDELMQYAPSDDGFMAEDWKSINRDIVAWIKIDGTSINYPVLQANNNDYYLVRNYRGEFATAGSIFLDYRNNIANDNFMIIYGHRMSGGGMFSDVTKYVDVDYFESHAEGKLYVNNGMLNMVAVGFAKIKNTNAIYAAHDDAFEAISQIKKWALLWDEKVVAKGKKYVLLSTCDAADKTLRDILLLIVL